MPDTPPTLEEALALVTDMALYASAYEGHGPDVLRWRLASHRLSALASHLPRLYEAERERAASEAAGRMFASECDEDCACCSGEYCERHINEPCDCDVIDRHIGHASPPSVSEGAT